MPRSGKYTYILSWQKNKTELLCMHITTNVPPGGTSYNGLYFLGFRYTKLGRDFTHECIYKGREICHFSLQKNLKGLQKDFVAVKSRENVLVS